MRISDWSSDVCSSDLFDAGYAADQGRKLGTSSFTMSMLDEGTRSLDSVEIAKRKQRLGAIVASGCGLDYCNASLNALDDQLKPSPIGRASCRERVCTKV